MSVGFNTFAPKIADVKFVVKNISDKTLKIFGFKIAMNKSYDLMSIDYVSEPDIKHSLLKGTLRNKINQNEITIIDSNISLVQYSTEFIRFMQGGGLTLGVRDHALDELILTDLIDMPAPVNGVITLSGDNRIYRVRGNMDIGTNRLIIEGDNIQLKGRGSQNDSIIGSTSEALVTMTNCVRIKDLRFTNPEGIGLSIISQSGTGSAICSNIDFMNCLQACNIQDLELLLVRTCTISDCSDGMIAQDIDDININELLFTENKFGAIALAAPDGSVFRSFSLQNSFFFPEAGQSQTAFSLDSSSVTITGRGIVKNNVFGGDGSALNGITKKDPHWWFDGNTGLLDSRVIGSSFFSSDTPETVVITDQSTWTEIDVTQSLSDASERFSLNDGYRLSYDGYFDHQANIIGTASVRVLSANSTTKLGLAINGIVEAGSVVETTSLLNYETFTLNLVAILEQFDEVSMFVQNTESTSNFEFRTVCITVT